MKTQFLKNSQHEIFSKQIEWRVEEALGGLRKIDVKFDVYMFTKCLHIFVNIEMEGKRSLMNNNQLYITNNIYIHIYCLHVYTYP